MESGVGAFLGAVVQPLFNQFGLGPIIAGLAVFVVGWTVFITVVGKKE